MVLKFLSDGEDQLSAGNIFPNFEIAEFQLWISL